MSGVNLSRSSWPKQVHWTPDSLNGRYYFHYIIFLPQKGPWKERHWKIYWKHILYGRTSNCKKNCLTKQSTALKSHQDPHQKPGRCIWSLKHRWERTSNIRSQNILYYSRREQSPAFLHFVGVMFQQRVRIHGADYWNGTRSWHQLEVRGNSNLVINQMNGVYEVLKPDLLPYHTAASELARTFAYFNIEHVPRGQNTKADALASPTPHIPAGNSAAINDLLDTLLET